jgi:hypothetical protein
MQTTATNAEHATPKKSGLWAFALGIALLVLFLAATLLLRGGKPADTNPEDAARDAERTKNLADLQAETAVKLNTYAWVDQAKGSVQIPIAEAMNLVVPALNAKKPAAAYPILDSTGNPIPSASAPDDQLPTQPVAATAEETPALAEPTPTPEPAPKNQKPRKKQ